MFKKSPLKAARLVRRKRRILLLKIAGLIIAVIAAMYGFSFLTNMQALAITEVKIEGNSAIDAADVERIARRHISGNYLLFFSKANRLIYPKNSIEHSLAKTFTRIEEVEVDVDNFHTLVVNITERQPSYVWCKGVPEKSDKDCYFVDAEGYIFSEAPFFSGNAFFAFHGLVKLDEPVGTHYLPAEEFHRLDRLITYIDSQGIDVSSLLVKEEGIVELHMARGGRLIFKKDQDIDLLQSNIASVLAGTAILSPKAAPPEYVDFRFGNKVYYKAAGDNAPQLRQ